MFFFDHNISITEFFLLSVFFNPWLRFGFFYSTVAGAGPVRHFLPKTGAGLYRSCIFFKLPGHGMRSTVSTGIHRGTEAGAGAPLGSYWLTLRYLSFLYAPWNSLQWRCEKYLAWPSSDKGALILPTELLQKSNLKGICQGSALFWNRVLAQSFWFHYALAPNVFLLGWLIFFWDKD